jgi:hypothetical protein
MQQTMIKLDVFHPIDTDAECPVIPVHDYGLIEAGADVNAKDAYGKTALMFAYDYDHTNIADLLKSKGAKL